METSGHEFGGDPFVSIRVYLVELGVKELRLVGIKGMRFFWVGRPIPPVFVSP
jgi:hypothetical protein